MFPNKLCQCHLMPTRTLTFSRLLRSRPLFISPPYYPSLTYSPTSSVTLFPTIFLCSMFVYKCFGEYSFYQPGTIKLKARLMKTIIYLRIYVGKMNGNVNGKSFEVSQNTYGLTTIVV